MEKENYFIYKMKLKIEVERVQHREHIELAHSNMHHHMSSYKQQ